MQLFSRTILFTGISCLLLNGVAAQSARVQASVNEGWKFLPNGAAYAETVYFNHDAWQTVSLPHTWNAEDPFDDDKTYRRGTSWYRKEWVVVSSLKAKNIYLYFEGAAQVAQVYVNGNFIATHKGGYTGFAVDATPFINWKPGVRNIIAVQVNNAHDPMVPPLNVGYASYGGIYRDVWMIATGKVHFASVNNNAGGVYITTPSVTAKAATLAVRTVVRNDEATTKSVRFVNTLFDAAGATIKSVTTEATLARGEEKALSIENNTVNNPALWSPESPTLYTVKSQLVVEGRVVDEVENKSGFRWFAFSAETGFSLNGKKYTIRGTNRHQDMKGKGDALTAEDHRRDLQLIKDMGANFVRLAHYPQTASVLSLADELGLLVWEETPVVNFITAHPDFFANATTAVQEMIRQGYNHPSVVMWGSTNEVFLHGREGERIGRQVDTTYVAVVQKLVRQLDSTVRDEDPARYSTMAMHVSADYAKHGLDTVSQVAGYNIYSGWYSGKVEDLGNDLDSRKVVGRPLFISEYGAEGEVRLNTEQPERFDYTGQYQRYFHEAYLRQMNARPWLAGTAIWNQFDFSQPNIGGPAPHMNQKGVATWDRKPKDVYYFYQAVWSAKPVVYIASRDWAIRGGEKGQPSTVDVYCNGTDVSLTVNGKSAGRQPVNDMKKASWQVRLQEGKNHLTATSVIGAKTVTDHLVIEYRAYDEDAKALKSIAVNVGSNAQYLDAANNVWIEDRPYKQGSFGYTGGRARVFDRKEVILNTGDEPMLYSYRDSITGYRFDVADGMYAITLCLAEPARSAKGERVFDIAINGERVITGVDLAASIGVATAMTKTFVVKAEGGRGVQLSFTATKGGAVLNGIRLQKQ